MHRNAKLRHLQWLIALLPVSVAVAQIPPLQPLGPPPPAPPGNAVTQAKVNLGKTLFWDEQLSSTRTVACGTCHRGENGGSDPRSVRGSLRAAHPGLDGVTGTPDDIVGSPGVPINASSGDYQWSSTFGLHEQVTTRRAPSHINAVYSPLLFWDGRATGVFNDPLTGALVLPGGGALESQSVEPPVSSVEMAHLGRDWTDIESRVTDATPLAVASAIPAGLDTWIAGRSYPQLFDEAFGSPQVTASRIALAIASYERVLFSNVTPLDSALAGLTALTPMEAAGMQLFGQLPCASCHAGPLTSDNQFHYIGVRPAGEDVGRFGVTGNPADMGAFRTPSLRNAVLRPSFMHNGRFATLQEVVDFYDRGGDFNAPNKDPRIQPLNLSPLQKQQLVAFLSRPLTDRRVADETAPFDRPTLFTESGLAPVVQDGGVAGAGGVPEVVAIEPPLAGNPSFTVGVYGTIAGAEAVLVIDGSEPPVGGGIPASGSVARVATTLLGTGAGDGYGSASVAIPDDPALIGQVVFGRWYVNDPAAPGGVAASPSFRMTVFGAHSAGLTSVANTMPGGANVLRLYPGQPNPFNVRTAIRYDVFALSPVRLTIYDISGRVVRRLVDSALQSPGTYFVDWDGRDDRGRMVAGGVYFSRLEGGGTAGTFRVVRVD